jgi:hypothetical protein
MTELLHIKPHHFLDILTRHGAEQGFPPHPLGHAQHLVAARVLADPQLMLELVLGADDICAPCSKLIAGHCTDMTEIGGRTRGKGEYNRALDERWLARLALEAGTQIIAADYARLARERMGDIYSLYPEWPREGTTMRRERLLRGIALYLQE